MRGKIGGYLTTVFPDIEVERPLPYAGGADPVLDRAVDYLAATAE